MSNGGFDYGNRVAVRRERKAQTYFTLGLRLSSDDKTLLSVICET